MRARDRLHGLLLDLLPPAHHDDVAPGGNGAHGRVADPEPARDRLHLQSVGKNHPAKPQLLPQQAAEDLFRQGGGELSVQGGIEHVGGHEGGNPCPDGAPERMEVPLPEGLPGASYNGKFRVGIRSGVPVAREVLPDGENAAGKGPAHEGDPELRGDFRVGGESTVPDHGVFRVAVDVENRGEVDVHPDGAKFPGHRLADGLRNARSTAAEQGVAPGRGKAGKSRCREAHHPAPFLVDCDERGGSSPPGGGADLPAKVTDLAGSLHVSREKDYPPHRPFPKPPGQPGRQRLPLEPDHQETGVIGQSHRMLPPWFAYCTAVLETFITVPDRRGTTSVIMKGDSPIH
jgi:hypothetical protein